MLSYNIVSPVIVPNQEFSVQFYAKEDRVWGFPFLLTVEPKRNLVTGIGLNFAFWIAIVLFTELLYRHVKTGLLNKRFGLKSLTAVVTLSAVLASLFVAWDRECRLQSEAMTQVGADSFIASDALPSVIVDWLDEDTECARSVVALSCKGSELPRLSSVSSISMIEITSEASNEDLRCLASFPNLVWLKIHSVGDAADVQIGGTERSLVLPPLKRLQSFSVVRSSYAGVGLSGMPSLRRLELSELELADGAVDEIVTLNSLKRLVVYGTQVSERQLTQIRETLPDCEIIR